MANTDPLSIRQLEVFAALVDHGSFTGAARHLGLSQSTVSGHIADLERRLGVRVVGRERSGVRPTTAGEALLKPAREALRGERNVRMAAAEMTGLMQGALAVGGSTIPAVYLLPRLLARFRRRHGAVQVNLITGDSNEILERVQHGDVDVGLVGVRPGAGGLVSEPVGGDELLLVVAPDHEVAGRASLTREEAIALPFVMREEGSGTRAGVLRALGVGDAESDLDVVCHVGSTEAAKAAVRAGLGASFLSSLAVEDELGSGALVAVPVAGLEVRRSFHLVAREPEHLSPAGRAFWQESLGQ